MNVFGQNDGEMQKNAELFIEGIKKDDLIDKYDEANTKNIIINRILGILGWNIFNHDEVELEYRTNHGKVDYTLKRFGNNTSFLEAKKASIRLNFNHEYQLLGYAKNEQINLAILSNGIEWRFYLPFEKGEKCRIDVLKQDTKHVATAIISLLSKNNIDSGDAIRNVKRFKQVPQSDSLPSFCLISTWKELLINVITYVQSRHRDFDKILNVEGKKGRIYFSRNRKKFYSPKEILNTGIYVETNLSGPNIMDLCFLAIEEFGYSEEDQEKILEICGFDSLFS